MTTGGVAADVQLIWVTAKIRDILVYPNSTVAHLLDDNVERNVGAEVVFDDCDDASCFDYWFCDVAKICFFSRTPKSTMNIHLYRCAVRRIGQE